MSNNFIKIAEPYKKTVGNVTYIVSAFGDAKTKPKSKDPALALTYNGEKILRLRFTSFRSAQNDRAE